MNFNYLLKVLTPGLNRATRYFIFACLALKCLFVATIFCRILFLPVNPYDLGELLLNYDQGFQRRSLVGSLVVHISHRMGIIDMSIKLICCFGIFCLFFLVFNPLKKSPAQLKYFIAVIILCSPFGMSFYSDLWLKKEILFFPLFLCAWSSFKIQNTVLRTVVLNLAIITGCLISETFLLLGFPFMICISYLNGVNKVSMASFILTCAGTLSLIYLLSVKPEPAMTHYIGSVKAMGFDTAYDFTHPVWFMRMGLIKSIQYTTQRLKVSYISIYFCLYFINSLFVFQIFKKYLQNPKQVFSDKVVKCILLLHLAILPLFFFGLDYGRWFSFAFITSFVLVILQLANMDDAFTFKENASAKIWVGYALFSLLIQIPQLTAFNIYHLPDYLHSFLTLFKPL